MTTVFATAPRSCCRKITDGYREAKSCKAIKQVVAYRFQRVYPGFITGPVLTVKAQRAEPVRPFMKQSDLMLHVASTCCMIVAIFGLAKPSALHDMAQRKYGVAAEFGLQPPHLLHWGSCLDGPAAR